MDILILCAGSINFTHLPVSTNTTNSMIPVNGKPVIGWILDDLIEKGILAATLVMREQDRPLREFLARAYASRMDLRLVLLEESHSILESLAGGLAQVKSTNLGLVLGDTLLRDPFYKEEDFVYVHEVDESHRWCLVETDRHGYIVNYYDKEKNVPKLPYHALCGFYHFADANLLSTILRQALLDGMTQLSELLGLYQSYRPIKTYPAAQWYDFGNIDNLLRSKQQLLQSRYFNTLEIDPVLNTITKVSEFDQKLQNELNWYESLPSKLSVLAPRIISKERRGGKLHLTQEYYGYPTLAELYLYSNLTREHWQGIIRKLMEIHVAFRQYPGRLPVNACREIYLDKTLTRLKTLRESDGEWCDLLDRKEIIANGELFLGWPGLKEAVRQRALAISENAEGCIIHGDYCFSNILYDFNNQIVRLIDPRGSFGAVGIYGDPRYDLAKLRHSIAGKYDYIVTDLFEVSTQDNSFRYELFTHSGQETITDLFDEAIAKAGYDPEEIKFIEALLFISMLPLHRDKPQRQKVMFITGIRLLNELIYKPQYAYSN